METFNITYSKKNIPIPSENEYKLKLITKTENFLKRLLWKALAFLGKLKSSDKDNYGFKTVKCPSSVKELVPFENDMMDMIKNLEFKRVNNEFQSNLRNDIRQIRRSNNLFISADKSRNIYKVSKASYERMMHENVTKTYKKCNTNKSNSINFKAKQIARKLKIDGRVQKLDENEAYVTIKHHKEGFPDEISCRLINPSEADIGKISKQILDRVGNTILVKNKVNQWKNMYSAMEWYRNIKRKDQCSFVVFDIESFYPSISTKLFDEAVSFAKLYYDFTSDELELIMHSRKTLLFWQDSAWVKKEGHEDFDIPMGCYDVTEICELVGIYIQNKLCKLMNRKDFGLYRDDGLGILRNTSGLKQIEQVRTLSKYLKNVDSLLLAK